MSLDLLHAVGLVSGSALMRDFTASLVVLDSLSVGPFNHKDLMLSRTESSVLGMPFLAQYKITFDFPERRVWFDPSERHGHSPGFDLSGLWLMSSGGECVVGGTRRGGPAYALGLEQGDIITSVGGESTAGQSPACIEAALRAAAGDSLQIGVSRLGNEFGAVLDLRWTAIEEADSLAAELPPN
jgi:hypothetical protein